MATQIAQKCRLPLRQIRCGLAVLVHVHLVYHHSTADGRSAYEANTKTAYNLARSGKIVNYAEEKFGQDAALIIAHILLVGQLSVGNLRKLLESGWPEMRAVPYGLDAAQTQTSKARVGRLSHQADSVDNILRDLAREHLILKVRQAHFWNTADNFQHAQEHINSVECVSTGKGKKWGEDMQRRLEALVDQRNEAVLVPRNDANGVTPALKRTAEESLHGKSVKKPKTANVVLHNPNGSGTATSLSAGDRFHVRHFFIVFSTNPKFVPGLCGCKGQY